MKRSAPLKRRTPPTSIVLSGEPKSTQHIYGLACRGRFPQRYMTPAGKALKLQYQGEARHQWKFAKPLEGDIEVSVTLYFGTKRKADLDNFNKLSLDALTGIVWHDDSQIADLRLRRAYDKKRPRIEIHTKAEKKHECPLDCTVLPSTCPFRILK